MREEGRRVRRANLKNIGQIKQRLLGGKERERSTELSGGDVGVSGTREGGYLVLGKGGYLVLGGIVRMEGGYRSMINK